MSIILGTNGSDVLNGTASSDLILAGNGNDTVDGGNGNDIIDGGNGSDTLTGGAGNDTISGDNGNDTIDAGAGDDLVFAGNGSDLVIHRASDIGGFDAYDGGHGQDTLRLIVSQAMAMSAAFQADVAQFQWQLDHHGSASGYFSSLDLMVTSFEHLQIIVENGNQAPTASDDTSTASEDTAVIISAATLLANDTDPDPGDTRTLVSVQGAVNGSVTINGSGDVVFTPAANFSGTASFTYTMQDSAGATSTATVVVAVAAVADTPTLSVANATGTENPEIALNIAAALTDTDGSETLTVEISGIPAGGTLNHGSESGGVWTVAEADLATLTFTPPTGFSGPLDLSVVARSTETSNGSTAVSAPQTLTVIVPIIGTNNDDTLSGTAGDDLIFALDGNDTIDAQGGNDTIHAGNGNDFIASGPGNDLIDGGAGLDRSAYTNAAAAITVMLAAGTVTAGASTDTLQSVEFIRGSAFADSYDATGFSGSSANAGSNGTFNEFEGLADNDTITGNGNTRISYVNATGGVDVNLSTGTATGDASVGTDSIVGGVNAVRGSQFNDIIRGTGGNETLEGMGGDDQLGGGPGADTLDGGTGFDTALYGLAGGAVTVNLAAGTATGASGNDTLLNIEAAFGSNGFGDTLIGNGLNNTLDGSGGDDVLQGGLGNDTLIGGAGIDIAMFSGLRSAYTFSAGQVAGPDGTDATNGVELLQFDDAFMLGFGLTPINLSGFALPNANPIFGRAVTDLLSIGLQANGRLIDLGGDNDTLTLTEFGTPTYNLNIVNVETVNSTGGIETVNLQNAASGLTVDLAAGSDTLNLANGTNAVTAVNVEFLNGGSGDDTVTFIADASVTNQEVALGLGTNVLNLAGADSTLVMSISGTDLTVYGQTDSGNEDIQLLNVQAGTTYDLGAGTDTITLWNDFSSVNVLTVQNVENVFGSGFQSDQITIAGNAAGATTVTGAGGADLMWASADEDRFRYTSTSDSPYDIPFGGQRDVIHDFDAAEDFFVLEGIPGTLNWEITSFGGATILRLDFNGDASGDDFWDMAIELENLSGTLSNANFLLV